MCFLLGISLFFVKYIMRTNMEERLISLLRLAIKYNATDIHFLCIYQDVKIEMRIDNKFRAVKTKFEDYKLIRYLQYLSNLDVGNLLVPQTGQFEMEVDNVLLSLRFAVINNINYTNGVLRILNSNIKVDFNNLSSIEKQNIYFRSLLKKNNGLVIFSGPTGSGKTTTVYSLLKGCRGKKIYTIEDPIEVYYDGFIQLQVNETLNFDYEHGIAQILRHDPDIIMIGEIRDFKAAKGAVDAANTGHLVFTTLHATSASSCISRLVSMGINEDQLYENLLCISNQRMMIDKKSKDKIVLYELMDRKEIEYYRKNKTNSEYFIDLESQIGNGINENRFEKDTI